MCTQECVYMCEGARLVTMLDPGGKWGAEGVCRCSEQALGRQDWPVFDDGPQGHLPPALLDW